MGWLQGMFGRRQRRRELEEEIEAHIAERAEALVAGGVTQKAAERQARVEFGNRHTMLERSVLEWQMPWIESLWADLKLAFRRLRRSPGYAVTAVLTLAIGIGANAAIFTVIDDAMLRSLPVENPGRLVELGYRSPALPRFLDVQPWPVFERLQHELHGLSGLSGWSGWMVTFPDEQNTLKSIGADLVTGNAFATLGVRPYLGRLLMPSDDVPGGPEGGWPIVLGYDFWLSNFHGDSGIAGRRLLVSGRPAVVVGVLPPEFSGLYVGQPQKLYLPLHFRSAIAPSPEQDPFLHPETFAVQTMARLDKGVSLAQLNAQLAALSTPAMRALLPPRLQQSPAFHGAHLAADSMSRGFSAIRRDFTEPLLLLQGLALCVLLLCCVNLAGLESARLQARRQEVALCAALGAGRLRMVQQSLVECLVPALGGGALAAVIAWFGLRSMVAVLTPAGWAQPLELRPDGQLLLVAAGLAVVTTLVFGFVPAVLAASVAPQALVKGASAGAGRRHGRFRWFVPVQFALALALVFTAGLFTHTLLRLRAAPLGFQPDHVTGVTAQFQSLKDTPEQVRGLYRGMLASLRASPGVESATVTWYTPLTGDQPRITSHAAARSGDDHALTWNDAGSDYFATMGMRVNEGRGFTERDTDRSVCVLNQAAVRLLFPTGGALGSAVEVHDPENVRPVFHTECRVVGTVADARFASVKDAAPATLYFPAASAVFADGAPNNLVFLIRSVREQDAVAAYRGALRRFAPQTGYMRFFTLNEVFDNAMGSERLIAGLSGTFALAALLLSGIGLFGVLALRVTERRPEIGVRMAVGATRGSIVRLVLGEAVWLTASGAVAGMVLIAGSVAFTRHFLYETSPVQPVVLAVAVSLLAVVALAAALLPAHRAASLDPARVLRR